MFHVINRVASAILCLPFICFCAVPFNGYLGNNWQFMLRDYTLSISANSPEGDCGVTTAAMIACQSLQNNAVTRDSFIGLASQFPKAVLWVEEHADTQVLYDAINNSFYSSDVITYTTHYNNNKAASEDWLFSENAKYILSKFKLIQSNIGDIYYVSDVMEEEKLISEKDVSDVLQTSNSSNNDVISNEEEPEEVYIDETVSNDPEEEIIISDLSVEEQQELTSIISSSNDVQSKISVSLRNLLTKKSLRDAIFSDIGNSIQRGNSTGTIGVYTEYDFDTRIISYESGDISWNISSTGDTVSAGIRKTNGSVNIFLNDEEISLSSFVLVDSARSKATNSIDVIKIDYNDDNLSSFVETFKTKRLKVYITNDNFQASETPVMAEQLGAVSTQAGGGGCFMR